MTTFTGDAPARDAYRWQSTAPGNCGCCGRSCWLAPDRHPSRSSSGPLPTTAIRLGREVAWVFACALVVGACIQLQSDLFVAAGLAGAALAFSCLAWQAAGVADLAMGAQLWSLAVAAPAGILGIKPTRGRVKPLGDLLEAPISGRSCIAFCVTVARRAAEEQCLLVEQRAVALQVGDQVLGRDCVWMPNARGRKQAPTSAASRAWLLARGVAPTDDVEVWEFVLGADAELELRVAPHPWMRGEVPTLKRCTRRIPLVPFWLAWWLWFALLVVDSAVGWRAYGGIVDGAVSVLGPLSSVLRFWAL